MENSQTKSTGIATKTTMDEQILAVMMGFHMDGNPKVTLKDVATKLGKHERNKAFRERWSILKNEKGYIGTSKISGTGFIELTPEGIEHAQTDEYKEMMKEMNIKSKTNSEHQERIKKRFKKPKSELIFNFLNEYDSLSSDDLAALVGQNKRSHAHHYSLKELREKGYAEEDPNHDGKGKKFRLTDNAFLKAEVDRVNDDAIDTEKLAEKIAEGTAVIESRIRKNKKQKSVKEELKVKDEESEEKGDNNEDTVPDIIKSERQKSVKEELKVKDEESEEKGDDDDDDDDDDNYSTAASNTGNNNNEDTVPDIIKSVKPEQIIEGSKNADLVNVALVHDEGKQQNVDDTNEAGPSDIPQFIGGEPVTNSSELLSDEVKVETTKNKETTSHKNNKRQRIKYEYLA